MDNFKSLLIRYLIVPCLRKSYPLLNGLLSLFSKCHYLIRLNQRFFLAQHLLFKNKVLQFDPSDCLTVKWIYQHLLDGQDIKPDKAMVIDIGANDGFLSSNSYNFIRSGWNAILVEPYQKNYNILLRLLSSMKIGTNQAVITKMTAIDEIDGGKYLSVDVPGDLCDMEGKLLPAPIKNSIWVETATVESLLLKNDRCRSLITDAQFIALSIDVEGKETEVIRQFFNHQIFAAIIIIETFRLDEKQFEQFMKEHGYRKSAKIHWNSIYSLTTLPMQ